MAGRNPNAARKKIGLEKLEEEKIGSAADAPKLYADPHGAGAAKSDSSLRAALPDSEIESVGILYSHPGTNLADSSKLFDDHLAGGSHRASAALRRSSSDGFSSIPFNVADKDYLRAALPDRAGATLGDKDPLHPTKPADVYSFDALRAALHLAGGSHRAGAALRRSSSDGFNSIPFNVADKDYLRAALPDRAGATLGDKDPLHPTKPADVYSFDALRAALHLAGGSYRAGAALRRSSSDGFNSIPFNVADKDYLRAALPDRAGATLGDKDPLHPTKPADVYSFDALRAALPSNYPPPKDANSFYAMRRAFPTTTFIGIDCDFVSPSDIPGPKHWDEYVARQWEEYVAGLPPITPEQRQILDLDLEEPDLVLEPPDSDSDTD